MFTHLVSKPFGTGRANLNFEPKGNLSFDSKLKNIFSDEESKIDSKEGLKVNLHQERKTNEQIEILHEQGIQLSKIHSNSQWQMVEVLSKIEENHGYAYFHCSSLREYAILFWNLSENVASDLVTVAKKSIHVPQIIEALKEGRGTLSKIGKVCPVIDNTNYQEWLGLVAECTSRIIEKTVAMAKPETAVTERVKYTSADMLEVTHGMTEEIYLDLQRAQDLLCQKERRTVSRSEALQYLIHLGLEKLDPIRKAKRAADRKANSAADRKENENSVAAAQTAAAAHKGNRNSKAATGLKKEGGRKKAAFLTKAAAQQNDFQQKLDQVITQNEKAVVLGRIKNLRKRFSAETTHGLALRDERLCTHMGPDHKRCSNRRWLHIHHIQPVANGGGNELSNLITLCSGHHRALHFFE